jgi:hypothetical protein
MDKVTPKIVPSISGETFGNMTLILRSLRSKRLERMRPRSQ